LTGDSAIFSPAPVFRRPLLSNWLPVTVRFRQWKGQTHPETGVHFGDYVLIGLLNEAASRQK
jgi:hypothetical protein